MQNKSEKGTKKQHYVPRCYLNRWGNEKSQVYVFDKASKKSWINNIYDIACERFFYDVDYKELKPETLTFLHEQGISPEKERQFVEHFLSRQETEYSKLLKKIIDREITTWHERNCYFIGKEDKLKLSLHLGYQLLRTKAVRVMMKDISNCVQMFLCEMNCDEATIKKNTLQSNDEEVIQGNMIFDIDNICEIAKSLMRLVWVLGINKTNVPFYTSDNPIGSVPHMSDQIMSMSGICSRGIEVYIPISPEYILIMVDGDYHTEFVGNDRKYVPISSVSDIESYNELCALNSNQYIFSNVPDFITIHKMIEKAPDVFEHPKISLSYGGRTYMA